MKLDNLLNVNVQLGKRIRFLRHQKKMTIEDLSFESNVNTKYLSDLERGKRNPTIAVINRIANGLNVTLSELLMGIKGE